MRVRICNLGVVKEADIDLKPLTVFIGPNNTGKTWAAYSLAAILGGYGWGQYLDKCDNDTFPDIYPSLEKAIIQAIDEGSAKLDLVNFANEYGQIYFNEVAKQAASWMGRFLGTKKSSFENLKLNINLEQVKASFLDSVNRSNIDRKIAVDRRRKNPTLYVFKEANEPTLYFYTEASTEKLPKRVIRNFLIGNTFQILHQAFFSNVRILPTERTEIVTASFAPVERNKKQSLDLEDLQETNRRSGFHISNVVNTFIQALETEVSERQEEALDDQNITTYLNLANLLEKAIIEGTISCSTEQPPRREVFFQPIESNTELEMSVVSSMVKELSPLVLYLRYVAKSGELLVIDEPEMSLHPKAQVRLIEFLAMLVEAGLNVLITTHSPYILDHLVNLMKAAESKNKETLRDKFYLQRTEAFISKNDVSVHLFNKNGKTENVMDKNDGLIEWDTFSKVSGEISKLYFEMDE